MSSVRELHNEAMDLADRAFVASRANNVEVAEPLFFRAYELERKAAERAQTNQNIGVTSAVLFRSAATLAVKCNLWAEAEELVGEGLRGSPPYEIAAELTALQCQIEENKSGQASLTKIVLPEVARSDTARNGRRTRKKAFV
jgi:hypothetical protein